MALATSLDPVNTAQKGFYLLGFIDASLLPALADFGTGSGMPGPLACEYILAERVAYLHFQARCFAASNWKT